MGIPVGGEPIVGILHSSDASGIVAVPIYNQGSVTARTLLPDEYIEVHSIEVVAAATGDTHVYFGVTSTFATGNTIVRGTLANDGGILKSIIMRTGQINATIWVVAAAGVVDVNLNGVIRKAGHTGRARYQASLTP